MDDIKKPERGWMDTMRERVDALKQEVKQKSGDVADKAKEAWRDVTNKKENEP